MNLRSIDLNLLTIFDAIHTESSVSKAANRLCMSQSSVSNALARLRTLFNDELFVRSPNGMLPTSKADKLSAPINDILRKIEDTFCIGDEFDCLKLDRKFSLAMSDYSEQIIMPQLMAWLEANAPNVELNVVSLNEQTLARDCMEGKIDIALGSLSYLENGFYCQNLVKDTFVSVARKNHPVLDEAWGEERFFDLSHVSISLRGLKGTAIDSALQSHKTDRRCVLRLPNFYSILKVVSTTNYIGDAPMRLVNMCKNDIDLEVLIPPFHVEKTLINQFWHERVNKSTEHAWFRKVIRDICAAE
ncbi:MAG: LysR family transcriptional regulator [Agarilytica sp.]